MSKFRDSTGDEWEVRITAGHLRSLREDFKLDLRDAFKPEGNPFAEALGDPERFVTIVAFLCDEQIQKRNLTPEQFAYRFDGDTLESAAVALFGAVSSFSRPRTEAKAEATFRKGLNLIDGMMIAAFDKVPEYLNLNSGAGNSAGPSPSTPDPSPSAS